MIHFHYFSFQVYGETSYELAAEIIEKLKIENNDIFLDLGSGVGQIFLQVAASTRSKMVYGIENFEASSFAKVFLSKTYYYYY